MEVPFKWLFSSWNQKGLLRAQVNGPWCNLRQAATSETKHKPRFLPEYSTKGMGSHCTHFQGAMCCILMLLYLSPMFWPFSTQFNILSESTRCLSLFPICLFFSLSLDGRQDGAVQPAQVLKPNRLGSKSQLGTLTIKKNLAQPYCLCV